MAMKGWARCVLICHQQKRTFGGWWTSSRDFAFSRFTFIEEAVKPVCTHEGGYPQAAEPKHSHFKGGIDVSSAIPSSIRLSEDLLSLAISRERWYHQILQNVQNLMPLQQLVSIVHRNRKRFLMSQSTLREEFAEKKYQVFDIIGLLIILVQVSLSSPVERV